MVNGLLNISRLGFRYQHDPVLERLDLRIERGEMIALLGPNGSGKSTLLNLLAGVLGPASGHLEGAIELEGTNLWHFPPRERARKVALVPQNQPIPFAFTVREWVSLGRTPYLTAFGGEREVDRLAVESALEASEVSHLADRLIGEISGGERQRAALAMALAQEPSILLLDEATAHLDLRHQVAVLSLVRRLNRERGLTVLAAVHDPNVASLWFDRLLVVHQGALATDGPPAEVLTVELLHSVFGAPVQVLNHPTSGAPLVVVEPDL